MQSNSLFTYKFIQHTYPDDHWALDPTREGACIAFFKFKGKYNYSLQLNPTDCRGYRSLVKYVGNEDSLDIQSTFNRTYTLAEQRGLSDVTTLIIKLYERIGLPIVQTAQVGNNSHTFDKGGHIQIGSENEPSILHTHVWGRGNPKTEYISGIPLQGPPPGEIFDMTAKSSTPGNDKKVKWEADQLEKGLQVFKEALEAYLKTEEFKDEFNGILEVEIYQPEVRSESKYFKKF